MYVDFAIEEITVEKDALNRCVCALACVRACVRVHACVCVCVCVKTQPLPYKMFGNYSDYQVARHYP